MISSRILNRTFARSFTRRTLVAANSNYWTNSRCCSQDAAGSSVDNSSSVKSAASPLLKHLRTRIKLGGPLTVHQYMREVLTNPLSGYYMKGNVIGEKGDFVTSPEISQLFGEMLGIWIINEWKRVNSPEPFNIAELGPGRGTLMKDIVKVAKKFVNDVFDMQVDIHIHLIEISKEMSNLQEQTICDVQTPIPEDPLNESKFYKSSESEDGQIKVRWYYHIDDLPEESCYFVANEFFDALPIHKFRKTAEGWREILIDLDESDDGPHHLRYVISRNETPATKVFIQPDEQRDEVEVCPEAGVVVGQLASRLTNFGGAALIVDYGHEGDKLSTFRAFQNHAVVDPLGEPGQADVTADVDFKYLKEEGEKSCAVYGPVTQRFYLHNMNIDVRLQQLLRAHSKDRKMMRNIISGYKMLIENDQMGERFKFLSLFPNDFKERLLMAPPAGFYRDPFAI